MRESELIARLEAAIGVMSLGGPTRERIRGVLKEAGLRLDPEKPPVVPKLGLALLPALDGESKGWFVTAHNPSAALSYEEASEVHRRASEKTWRQLLELATAKGLGTDARGRLDLIRRILEGEE